MTTKMNLNGTTRKALVAAIAEITGDAAFRQTDPEWQQTNAPVCDQSFPARYPCILQ